MLVNNLHLNAPRYTLNRNSTTCRRKETFPLKTVSKSREVPQDAVMVLSLPEHQVTRETAWHGKTRVKCT